VTLQSIATAGDQYRCDGRIESSSVARLLTAWSLRQARGRPIVDVESVNEITRYPIENPLMLLPPLPAAIDRGAPAYHSYPPYALGS